MTELELRNQFNEDFKAALLAMLWDEVMFQLRCRVDEENRRWFAGDTRFSQELGRCLKLKASEKTAAKLDELCKKLANFEPDSGRYNDLSASVCQFSTAAGLNPLIPPSKPNLIFSVEDRQISFKPLVARYNLFVQVAKKTEKTYGLEQQATPVVDSQAVKAPSTFCRIIIQEIAGLYGISKKDATKDDLLNEISKKSNSWLLWLGLSQVSKEYNAVKNLLDASEKLPINNSAIDEIQRGIQVLSQLKKFSSASEKIAIIRQKVFSHSNAILNAFSRSREMHNVIEKDKEIAAEKAAAAKKQQAEYQKAREEKERRIALIAKQKAEAEAMAQAKLLRVLQDAFVEVARGYLVSENFIAQNNEAPKELRTVCEFYYRKYSNAPKDALLLLALVSWFNKTQNNIIVQGYEGWDKLVQSIEQAIIDEGIKSQSTAVGINLNQNTMLGNVVNLKADKNSLQERFINGMIKKNPSAVSDGDIVCFCIEKTKELAVSPTTVSQLESHVITGSKSGLYNGRNNTAGFVKKNQGKRIFGMHK